MDLHLDLHSLEVDNHLLMLNFLAKQEEVHSPHFHLNQLDPKLRLEPKIL
jgi:hypothetical protein